MMQPYLPDWIPWWAPALVLVPLLFFGIAFLAMPFSVFGIKSRLEEIEARLDEIQGEIRSLAFRLPEPDGSITYRESMLAPEPEPQPEPEPEPPPRPRAQPERAFRLPNTIARPPIPPIPPVPRQEQPAWRAAEEEDEPPPAPPPRQYRPIFRRPQPERGEPAPERTEPRLDWPR